METLNYKSSKKMQDKSSMKDCYLFLKDLLQR